MTVNQLAKMNTSYYSLYANNTNKALQKSIQRLSSGYRINSAADDPAGLSVSEKMRGQIRGLSVAESNATMAMDMIDTADGHLSSMQDILKRMGELAVQATNGTYTQDQRDALNMEFSQLRDEVDRIASSSNFNGINLLDGTLGGTKGTAGIENLGVNDVQITDGTFNGGELKMAIADAGNGTFDISMQYGDQVITRNSADMVASTDPSTPNAGTLDFAFDGGTITLDIDSSSLQAGGTVKMYASGTVDGTDPLAEPISVNANNAVSYDSRSAVTFQVGANGTADNQINMKVDSVSAMSLGLYDLDISSIQGANQAIEAIKTANNQVSSQRGTFAATYKRMEYTVNNLSNTRLNLTQAESKIRDTDFASEILNYTQLRIQQQVQYAMLLQGSSLSRQTMLGLLLR